MFRKVFFQIYRVLHSLWAYAQQLTGEPPQKPLDLRTSVKYSRRLLFWFYQAC